MLTLFPVQTARLDDGQGANAMQWQLINNLFECCLLEKWVPENRIEMVAPADYLADQDIDSHLALLPEHYQAFFARENALMVIHMHDSKRLLLLVEPAYCAPWRLHKPCLPLAQSQVPGDGPLQPLDTAQNLLEAFLSVMDQAALKEEGILKLKETLAASVNALQQSAVSDIPTDVYNRPHWYQTLIAAEQWASLMDRPFHPLAKGKLGLTPEQYQTYMAEFNQPLDLRWIALAKSHLMLADNVKDISTQNPASYLLNGTQQQQLMLELQAKKLLDTHIAIPVHPWQMDYVIDDFFDEDLANGTVVKLTFSDTPTYASSSLRSMLPSADNPHSIKLPMGVHALNSKRYLPALKLVNGEKNQAILMQARKVDAVLSKQLRLWDERLWWGYMQPSHLHDKSSTNPYFYQEKPTHLGAMLRSLPTDLCDDHVKLLPMASLGMLVYKQGVGHHIFDDMIKAQPPSDTKNQVVASFKNLCDVFLGTMLRCLRLGFAPEMHGQNILIVAKGHRFTSLLLRDHDSVRIHLPWLTRYQIADPEYLSPPNFRNRLYRDTPEDLIFYLQSLGILVNLRAVIEALAEHYHIAEDRLWREVMGSIENALVHIDFSAEQHKLICEHLLVRQDYPHKTLLLPVIERGADPHGSMPAGESSTVNPFMRVNTPLDRDVKFDKPNSIKEHVYEKSDG